MKKFLIFLLCLFLTGCQVNNHEPTSGNLTLSPLPENFTVEQADNCTIPVSFQKSDVFYDANGIGQINLTVHQYEKFDSKKTDMLSTDDTIIIDSEKIVVHSLSKENKERLLINGGLDAGGYELSLSPEGFWYVSGYNDSKAWYEAGTTTFPVSEDFVYIDASDLDNPPLEYSFSYLIENDFSDYVFSPHSTTAIIRDGKIVMLKRIYIP